MTVTIDEIYRYPVKGLTAEPLPGATLTPGQGLASDRRFALTLGTTPVTGPTMPWMPKTAFLTLMKNEKLTKLTAQFDDRELHVRGPDFDDRISLPPPGSTDSLPQIRRS